MACWIVVTSTPKGKAPEKVILNFEKAVAIKAYGDGSIVDFAPRKYMPYTGDRRIDRVDTEMSWFIAENIDELAEALGAKYASRIQR